MKTYNSPMLQVVSIKRNDIITGSDPALTTTEYTTGSVLSAGHRNVFDEWYEGY